MFSGFQDYLEASDGASLKDALGRCSGWTVAALDYELGTAFEAAAAIPGQTNDPRRPPARFWRFADRSPLTAEAVAHWLSTQLAGLDAETASAGIGGLDAGLDEAAYAKAVERIRAWIAAGDCYQVNFTFPLHFRCFGTALALYARLRREQPVRYGGILVHADGAVVSLSPELFLERRGEGLTTRPMKGTAPKGGDASDLQRSAKNRAENLMIVDLLRNDLGRVALTGSVQVESLFAIEEYPSLRQMVSQISARVPETCTTADILAALFPCGSITGAPKIRAMQIIGELEGGARGLYTGAFGWLAPNGDFRLNVAIRTLELDADGRGRMGIGSGIVADSVAADEWRECWLKAAFLGNFDPGFRLIETLRCEDGVYPRLTGHLARLSASAAWLGFVCDLDEVRAVLARQAAPGLWRVRLTLNKLGRIETTSALLPPLPPGALSARLSAQSIDSRHPLRGHKTTVRTLYDRALAELAGQPEIFDTVFLNERGEVAEGARSNVFVDRRGVLLTPPLASGALPGVLRAELLADGRAREAVLKPADLAGGFWLGNALRGMVRIRAWRD